MNYLVLLCHRCDTRQRHCSGRCVCLASGRDILDHARTGDCPHPAGSRFVPRPRGWGDRLKTAIDATGLGQLARAYERITGKPCGCPARQQRLNRLGSSVSAWWRGTVRRAIKRPSNDI